MTADRLYAALLCLFPKAFRDEYGGEMLAAFGEMRRARRAPALRFWTFIVADTARAAARERLDGMRWLATALAGLVVTAGVAHAGAWAFRYFYHPFLESVVTPPWAYGVALGLVLGGTVGVSQWLLLPAAQRHPRSWALASGVALPLTVLFCSAALDHAMAGLNPIVQPHPAALDVLVLGIARPNSWADLASQFSAMAASALLVRALILTPSGACGQPRAGASGSA